MGALKVRYEGSFEVSKTPGEVFEFLTDPRRFSRAFPGFKSVEVEDGSFTIELRLSLGPLRGDARVRASFEDLEKPSKATVKGSGRGAGSTLDFTLRFAVEPSGGGSRVSWVFEGNVGGLAASMGGRVLDSLARRMINDVISGVKRELGEA
ncbi:CoxG homolog [Aeropyrum pernix]|uniref:CoxG homolog n=1 Tax=Aeropyrum pernix TaxID=56636 RepID=A0A401HAT4_AERPX|nr:CoxG homolog [Aeropyrum pernix]